MSHAISRPPPHVPIAMNAWTRPFWEAAAEHRLVAPRCAACAAFRMPPTPFCPSCRSQSIDWVTLPGTARLYAWTVVRRAATPELERAIPYVPAVVTLDGAAGLRLITSIIDAPLEALAADGALVAMFDDGPDGVTVPRFRLAGVTP